jgi:hypothetical protein
MITRISHYRLSFAVLIGLLILFSSACQSQTPAPEKPLPTESVLASATPPPLKPTATATAPPPSPTLTGEEALIEGVMAAVAPESLQVFTSPDQSWRVETIRYDCTLVSEASGELAGVEQAYELLLLTGPNGKVTPLAEQLQNCGGLGAAGINGLFWSPNGKYFYFDMAREGVPDGMPCMYWHTGKSRLNIETLEVEALPGKGLVSPDGFMFLLVEEQDFILWDLDQGEVGRSAHPHPGLSVKSIAFSPDGSRAVYVLREDCIQPGANSVVVVLNLADLTHTIVLESSAPSILKATWESNDSISLLGYDGGSFELSLSTGEITPR